MDTGENRTTEETVKVLKGVRTSRSCRTVTQKSFIDVRENRNFWKRSGDLRVNDR